MSTPALAFPVVRPFAPRGQRTEDISALESRAEKRPSRSREAMAWARAHWRPKPARNERFWRRVDKGDGCWLWLGSTNTRGYGQFGFGNHRCVLAHRYAWEITNGPIPSGMSVLHSCDNPPCVNPSHLRLGTRAENNAEMAAKGRGANQNTGKAHCVRGHDAWKFKPNGERYCHTCRIELQRARRARRAATA